MALIVTVIAISFLLGFVIGSMYVAYGHTVAHIECDARYAVMCRRYKHEIECLRDEIAHILGQRLPG